MKKIFLLFTLMTAVACIKQEPEYDNSTVSGDLVEVSLGVSVLQPETKAVHDPESITNVTDVIKNLWVIQFNGTSDSSELIGEPTYISNFAEFDGNIKLVATSQPSVIWLIANTFEGVGVFSVPQGTTLGDLKNKKRILSTETDILSKETVDILHPIFNGSVTETIGEGVHLAARLKRNIAKVNFTVINNTGDKTPEEQIVIERVTVRSVPSISYYINNFQDLSSPFPAVSEFTKKDYESYIWEEGSNSLSKTVYLPANLRGKTTLNTSPAGKNSYAPDGATYIQVMAYYTDKGVRYPISYSFYLGENLLDDFNVVPNKNYTYTFEINSKGDADEDSRIEDWGLVDFSDTKYELANCYILNPPPGAMRNFRIPIQRIHDFWGTSTIQDYEDNDYLSLRDKGDGWRAFILAADFDIDTEKIRLTKSTGKTGTDTYFEVQVSSDVPRGNIIIAVGPDDESNFVSWSWHLWITDYNPEAALRMGNGIDGQYVYTVTGGSVHRYVGTTLWDKYKNKYIMDRNLGYGDKIYSYPEDNNGLLHYQYGRKDPFFHPRSATTNNYKYPESHYYTYSTVENSVANTDMNSITYAVTHPLHFIKGTVAAHEGSLTTWCHNTKYNPASGDRNLIWFDPHTTKGGKKEGEKSIFDPCPPGFRVPTTATWQNFTKNDKASGGTTNVIAKAEDETLWGFSYYKDVLGLQYWPYVENQIVPADLVYYPATGYINPATTGGYITQAKEWTFAWADKVYSSDRGYGMNAQPVAQINSANATGQGRGLPVRCITDN